MYEQPTSQDQQFQSQQQPMSSQSASFNQPQFDDQLTTKQPGWWKRNWIWAVPSICATLVVGGIGLFVGLFALVFGVLKSTEVYETALFEARTNPAVIAELGNQIEDGLLFTGNMEVNPTSGYADIVIPISGQMGSGSLYLQAEKTNGIWEYYTMEVVIAETGESIDLLGD